MSEDSRRAVLSAAELANLLESGATPVIIDVRWLVTGPSQHPAYLAGHLPGAQWCDLDADLADPPGAGGRHPLPAPDRLQARLRAWGVQEDSDVVVYDGGTSVAAARAWWVLRWAGVTSVRVLDGGFAAWVAADGPIEFEVQTPIPGTVTVRPGSLPVLDAAAAAELAQAGRLVDVRAPERFRGEVEPMDAVAGRIPGAVNLPTTENVLSDGQFAPARTLQRRFEQLPAEAGPVGVYCGSGVTAAHTLLAMELAGVPAVLYPGSWSEWITDPARPVATGPADSAEPA